MSLTPSVPFLVFREEQAQGIVRRAQRNHTECVVRLCERCRRIAFAVNVKHETVDPRRVKWVVLKWPRERMVVHGDALWIKEGRKYHSEEDPSQQMYAVCSVFPRGLELGGGQDARHKTTGRCVER
jgi:hypothetical protein